VRPVVDVPAPAELPATPLSGWQLWRPRLLLLAAQLITGVVIGFIWLKWSPRTVSYLLSNGGTSTYLIPAESEARIAGDGRFVVLTLIAGLLFGVVAWLLRRVRGPVTLAVLLVGSVLSSLLARAVGELFAPGSSHGAVNTAVRPSLTLYSVPALWLQALLAVLVYTVLTGLSSDVDLGGPPSTRTEPVAEPALEQP
jgi:hypothetical protein